MAALNEMRFLKQEPYWLTLWIFILDIIIAILDWIAAIRGTS